MKLKYTLLALAGLTLSAQAAVYVNFNGAQAGGGVATGDPFGVPTALWANTGNVATDATGISVGGANLTWASTGTWGDNVAASSGDESIYGGYLDDNNAQRPEFTLSGLTAALGGSAYTIIVYSFSDDPNNGLGNLILNGGTPTAITSSTSTGNLTGNYGITTFTGVTGDSFTVEGNVTAGSAGRPRATIAGFQVVAVPEPSSTALLGLGGLALILRRRK